MMFRKTSLLAIFLAGATPAFAQSSMSAMPMAAQPTNQVMIKNFDYAPMAITIAAGSSVTWTNLDGEPHTITNVDGLFRSGAIDQGESYTFRFDRPGVYAYLCSIHPKMRATVTVK